MTESPDEIRSHVEAQVRRHLIGFGPLRAVTALHSKKRVYSSVMRFRLCFESQELDACVKIHRRSDTPGSEKRTVWAGKEFELLKIFHAAQGRAAQLSVVRPLLLLPDLPGILLETHPGQILSAVLNRRRLGLAGWRGSRQELERHYAAVGSSLREFQDVSTTDAETRTALSGFPFRERGAPEVLADAEDGFRKALARVRPGHRPRAEEAFSASREAFLASTSAGFPRVGVHGDFTPVNVFVHQGRVTLFDFVNFHWGHMFEDVSRFVGYTYFLQKDPLSFRPIDISALISAFLEGYRLPGWRTDPVLGFFFKKSMCRTLGGGLRFQSKRWPWNTLYEKAMLRVFHRWIDQGMTLA